MKSPEQIDLNSDVGESFGRWQLGDDPAMLRIVTSANVACGFHAGDATTLRQTCADAVAAGVVIGAQVSYRDLAGFGRRFIDVEPRALADDVLYQLAALDGLARVAGSRVRYLKPHGALYNAIVHHREQARAVVQAVCEYDETLPVLGLPGSVFLDIAERAGLRVVREAFADRAYTAEGTLVPRTEPGAVLTDPDAVAVRVPELARVADSICVHSDTPGAVAIARRVRETLDAEQISIRPFAEGP